MSDQKRVIVIGAGLIGLFTGYELARRGRAVLVLERDRIASGTTGTSFAWLNATSKTEPDYHRLNAAGLRRHMAFSRTWGEQTVGLCGAGTIWWAEPDVGDGIDAMAAHHEALRALDYPSVWLERHALAALEPRVSFADGAAGILAPGDRWLEAGQLARHLAREIERLGGEVREASPATDVVRGNDGRVEAVVASGERLDAAVLVLAAGPSTADAVAMVRGHPNPEFPVGRVPGLVLTMPADTMRTLVHHILYTPDPGDFHIRPTADGGLIMGADDIDETIGEDSSPEALSRAARVILERGRRYVPDLAADDRINDAERRIGVRPMPADDRTIAGALPGVPECYVIATHSGITLAPVLGELIAEEIVSGEVAEILAPFRPDRFDPP